MARQAKPAIRRSYNDTDKWMAYNHWLSTGRVTKQTARECYLSVSTFRAWVKTWDVDHLTGEVRNPPTKPSAEEIEEFTDVDNLLPEYKSLRRMALDRLREVIPKTNSADQLGRIVTTLGQEIARSEGMTDSPGTVNINIRLEEAKSAAAAMLGGVQKMIADAGERHNHIIEVESQEIVSSSEEVPNE